MDVFREIAERYDLILCFNLLLPDYFTPREIAEGMRNLTAALEEGGILIMGEDRKCTVHQKRGGELVSVRQERDY